MTNVRTSLDPVVELRLRQWARRNYVSAEIRRDADWHEVVVDEMRKRDLELRQSTVFSSLVVQTPQFNTKLQGPVVVTSAGIVPLAPSLHDGQRIDQAHAPVRGPSARMRAAIEGNISFEAVPYYA